MQLVTRMPPGLLSVRRRRLVGATTAAFQMCHSPEGLRHTPLIPSREASVAPVQVFFGGRISQRCMEHSASEMIRCRYQFILLWTAALVLTHFSVANLSACWSRLNTPRDL